MPTNYCPTCGSGNKYELTAPRFCQSCGGNFDATIVAKAAQIQNPPKPKLVPYGREDDEGYDDGNAGNVRIPKKLAVEIILDPPQRETLGSIMRGTNDSIIVEKGGKKLSKKAVKERVEAWRTNLQTLKRHDIGGGNVSE